MEGTSGGRLGVWARHPLRWVPNPILAPSASPPRAGTAAHPAVTQLTDNSVIWGERSTPSRTARMAARYALLHGWRRAPSSQQNGTGDDACRAAALARHRSQGRETDLDRSGEQPASF